MRFISITTYLEFKTTCQMLYIEYGFSPKFFFRKEIKMLKSLFAALFTKSSVHSKASTIRGNMSNGSVDRPGVWWK